MCITARFIAVVFIAVFSLLDSSAYATIPKDDVISLASRISINIHDNGDFPEPNALRPNINFWVDIYSKYNSSQAVIHDMHKMGIRYEVIDLSVALKPSASHRQKKRFIRKRKRYYKNILRSLSRKNGNCTTSEECRVVRLFGGIPDNARAVFRKASRSLRGQIGLSDHFKKGLETSGLYMPEMKRIFRANGLPERLLALPHVESSFNVNAYSHVGAAGIWQFTRSTGRLFLTINYSIDERRDPLLATRAAARLLKRNYKTLRSWPLAVTAYNHGRRGMQRAKKRHGNDIVAIVNKYKSRSFGFASRNFYAEFLAASKVASNPEKYFGHINYEKPIQFDKVKIKHYIPFSVITKHFGYSRDEILSLNRSLRHSVVNGKRRVPKGYILNIPHGTAERFKNLYASLPKKKLFKKQLLPDFYTVRRGDSLSVIARRFRTTARNLQAYNDLRSRHRIYEGQKLRIPPSNGRRVRFVSATQTNRKIVKASYTPTIKKDKKTAKIGVNELRSSIEEATSGKLLFAETPDLSDFGFVRLNGNTGILKVKMEETIGHYSNWAGVATSEIRSLNGGRRLHNIHSGQWIKVPLRKVSAEKFLKLRYEYHLGLYEDFFNSYKVEKVEEFSVRSGDSLWSISNQSDGIPLWLLSLYNKDTKLDSLQPGQKIRLPVIASK